MSEETERPENVAAPAMLGSDAIYIDREIGRPENTDDDATVTLFGSAEMRRLLDWRINAGAREITLAINSIGGSVVEAFAIVDMIKECQASGVTFIAECFGVVASAATLISSVCNKVISQPNCSWLIHNPVTRASGTAAELRETADDLEAWQRRAIDIYATKTGRGADELLAVMNEGRLLSAEEARALGLVDEITGTATTAEMSAEYSDIIAATMTACDEKTDIAEKINIMQAAMRGAAERVAALEEANRLMRAAVVEENNEKTAALEKLELAEVHAAEMRELVDNMTTEKAEMAEKLATVTAERDELNRLKMEGYFTDQLPASTGGAPLKFASFAEAEKQLGYAGAMRLMTGLSK